MKKLFTIAGIIALGLVLFFFQNPQRVESPGRSASVPGPQSRDVFARAFADHRSNFVAEGNGTVARLLSDDNDGERHQRFIVELAAGQTLLIAHNIDLAPRVDRLRVGDTVEFKGEYEWSNQGGVMHWTHHDPQGKQHEAGWIRHNGRNLPSSLWPPVARAQKDPGRARYQESRVLDKKGIFSHLLHAGTESISGGERTEAQ